MTIFRSFKPLCGDAGRATLLSLGSHLHECLSVQVQFLLSLDLKRVSCRQNIVGSCVSLSVLPGSVFFDTEHLTTFHIKQWAGQRDVCHCAEQRLSKDPEEEERSLIQECL